MLTRASLLLVFACVFGGLARADDRPSVSDSDREEYVTVKALGAKGLEPGSKFSIDFEATIESGWHMYSLFLDPNLGVATKIEVGSSPLEVIGTATESKPKSHYSELMGGMMIEHYDSAKFSLPMQVPAGVENGSYTIPVSFTYQICDANMCLPPSTFDFEVPVVVGPDAEVVDTGLPAGFEETRSDADEYVLVVGRGVNGVESGNEFELIFNAKIETGWHMYSLHLDENLGVPTLLTVGQSPFEVIGPVTESPPKSHHSELMGGTMLEHYDGAQFKVPMRVPDGVADGRYQFPVAFRYQICDANMCLPPVTLEFEMSVKVGEPLSVQMESGHRQTITERDGDLKVTAHWPPVVERGETFKIRFDAEIADGWHIYSIYDDTPDGSLGTKIRSTEWKRLKSGGDLTERGEPSEHDGSLWLEDKASWSLPVIVPEDAELGETTPSFVFEYLLCDFEGCKSDTTLPDSFKVKVQIVEQGQRDSVQVAPIDFTVKSPRIDPDAAFVISATVPNGGIFKPGEEFVLEIDGQVLKSDIVIPAIEASLVGQAAQQGLWAIVLFGIVGALFALITPCVYPMIPITVSMFTKHSEDGNSNVLVLAIVFAVGIVVTFTAIGFAASVLLGPDAGNIFAANGWVNLFLGALFVVFAFSLFGYYDISLPSWFTTKVSGAGSGGGVISVILMGFVFSVTTFTCVGPIVATLLALAVTSGGQWLAVVGMISFSATFAVPFFCLALFPKMLQGMPRSGGWLNAVKVVLGFVELAAAFKFFSVVPLDFFGANLLFRELVLLIWAIIFALTAAYLFGLYRFKFDSPVENRSLLRLAFVALFVGTTAYCLYGSTGRLIAGGLEAQITESFFVDPHAHSSFASEDEKPWRTRTIEAIRDSSFWGAILEPDARSLPWRIHSYETKTDLDETFASLESGDKRIFINFTGHT